MFEFLDRVRELIKDAYENLSSDDFENFLDEAENILNSGEWNEEEDYD